METLPLVMIAGLVTLLIILAVKVGGKTAQFQEKDTDLQELQRTTQILTTQSQEKTRQIQELLSNVQALTVQSQEKTAQLQDLQRTTHILSSQSESKTMQIQELLSNVQTMARQQYQEWVDAEREQLRIQQYELATREASATLEAWKSASEIAIRTDAIQRSQAVTIGKVTEHLVPYLPTFTFNPKDARFIGSPVDLLVFDGLDDGALREIVLVEVKTGASASLSTRERQIRDAVRAGKVTWRELRVERSALAATNGHGALGAGT